MPVFFQNGKRVLFIHVPKAGGTSIEAFFDRNGFKTFYLDRGGSPDSLNPLRRCSPQHMCAEQLRALFVLSRFDYVFMTVRHPIARLVSKFVMETGGGTETQRLEAWIADDFARVLHDREAMDNHLRPQSDFLVPAAAVFRMEDGLDERIPAQIEARLGLRLAETRIGREMSARAAKPDFGRVHAALRRMVCAFYQEDFHNFGYAPASLDG